MKNFCAALRFLTSVPVPGSCLHDDLGKTVVWFPVVGVVIGVVVACSGWLLYDLLPPMLASVAVVFILMAITGGFHLDGLADCADGFFSARPREQVLEIMRDSRVGGMGVIALIFILLFKISALAAMDQGRAIAALFLMPVAGRSLMVVKMAIFTYVRREGIASPFLGDRQRLKTASYISLGILYSACWFTAGMSGLFAGAGTIMCVGLFGFYCKQKIGGITGDTLGAASELAEAAMAVGLALTISG
nr:adenosylcobinamide-GDP ribazoletransferase [Desulfobulbaceae bacterium]